MALKLQELTKEIIGAARSARLRAAPSSGRGAAIEVHKALGPGLLGPATEFTEYTENGQETLFLQCSLPLLSVFSVFSVFSVARQIAVEIKCVNELLPVHDAQLLTYMRLGGSEVGLLMDFHVALLKQGLRRKVL